MTDRRNNFPFQRWLPNILASEIIVRFVTGTIEITSEARESSWNPTMRVTKERRIRKKLHCPNICIALAVFESVLLVVFVATPLVSFLPLQQLGSAQPKWIANNMSDLPLLPAHVCVDVLFFLIL